MKNACLECLYITMFNTKTSNLNIELITQGMMLSPLFYDTQTSKFYKRY